MYLTGVDRDGSPSWTWRPALADPPPAAGDGHAAVAAAERRVRGLVRMMERAWAVNPAAAEAGGVTVLCDCSGLSASQYDHRAALAALAVLRVRGSQSWECGTAGLAFSFRVIPFALAC